jgi:dihydroxy-acid dehydratase
MTLRRKPEDLRSHRWFGASDMRGFGHHSRAAQMSYSRADYEGKPIIAVINTLERHQRLPRALQARAEVKRGVLQAGGFPLEMPAIALAEVFRSRRRCSIATCSRWRPRSCSARIRSTARC